LSGLFVTGTDTGCGKTTVGASIARSVRAAGRVVRVLKPVETGCALRGRERIAVDALTLAEAAGDRSPRERLCPYPLLLAAAPQVAAAHEGVELDLARIDAAYRLASAGADLVIVEGAGGLRVPLVPGVEMGDLARRLGLPLLVVARARLGTLNHTLLTLEAAAARHLPVVGVVFSHGDPDLAPADRANLELLRRLLPVPCLGELGHGASALSPPLDVPALLAALARA
jgi:dethiobiotin synthetase